MNDTNPRAPVAGEGPSASPPSREQRLALVRALQAQALRQEDPLAANLGVLSADLMGFAHTLAPAVQAGLTAAAASAEGRRRFGQDAELYLKFVRQIDRLAQFARQRPSPPRGEAHGG
jgi:hypothetical protein